MPEGPEIRIAADKVDGTVTGHVATSVYFGLPHLEPFAAELTGQTVERVVARGKAMVTTFANGWHVYSHNQLYGRWYVRKRNGLPKTSRSLRFAIRTRHGSAFLYSASDIHVLEGDAIDGHPYLAKLGPDPLTAETKASTITARARSARFRGRSFGALLLDQSFVAGLGNYLRSEILFFAGLHPRRRPRDCSPADLVRLGRHALNIPRRSYETRGITNRPGDAQRLKREGAPRRVYRHAVFGLDGRPCLRCESKIEKSQLASRRIYWCPTCQPEIEGGA
ncbi:MAG: endonuclease VIII [Acidobacteriota bacterium]